MDNLICAAQGDATQKQRVSELMLRSLKEICPSIPGEIRDSARLKKVLDGDGDWMETKYILGRVVDTEKGTLLLSPKLKDKILSLLDTPPPPPHTHMLLHGSETI